MKSLVLTLLLAAGITTANAQTNWNIDASHTNVGFTVTHLVISEVDGRFGKVDGKLISKNDDFSDSYVEATVQIASINTDNERRDGHLKGDDFFSADKYPTMTFKSKSFKKVGDKKYKVVGDLTIRDVTKEVTLDVKLGGTVTDPWGNQKVAFKATTEINRFDYNLKWDAAIESGGLVVGEMVTIKLNVEFNKEKK